MRIVGIVRPSRVSNRIAGKSWNRRFWARQASHVLERQWQHLRVRPRFAADDNGADRTDPVEFDAADALGACGNELMRRMHTIAIFMVVLGVPLVLRGAEAGAAHTPVRPTAPAGEPAGHHHPPSPGHLATNFRWAFADCTSGITPARDLEFLSPGGSNDIKRQLDKLLQQVRASHGGSAAPRRNSMDVGIDLVWGRR